MQNTKYILLLGLIFGSLLLVGHQTRIYAIGATDPATTPTPAQTETEKHGTQSIESFYNSDACSALTTPGEKVDCSKSDKVATFYDDISTTDTAPGKEEKGPCGTSSNIAETLFKFFSQPFAFLMKGSIETGQTTYNANDPIPQPCGDDIPGKAKQATQNIKDTLLPPNPNPLRDTADAASFKEIRSNALKEIISTASKGRCVPAALIMAISQREAGATFGYSDEQVTRYSTNDWQNSATEKEKQEAYCYNTCANPTVGCLGSDVQGPMQFEKRTWDGLYSQIKSALVADFHVPNEYIPDRCNLRDAIVGAAVKIKQDSKTGAGQCTGWDDNTVTNNVAGAYCGGGCVDSSACGVNYCGNVLNLYKSYSATY